jgi:hypothetical protein
VNKDAYIHYEFVTVKCAGCGKESDGFVYKEHLNPDETIEYIEQITGFVRRPADHERTSDYVGGFGYNGGGLACQECQGIKSEEVANG